MIFLIHPRSGQVYRLNKEGKEGVDQVILDREVPFKFGPHMVNFVAYYRIDPSEINYGYYDGGGETYNLLRNTLLSDELPGSFEDNIKRLARLLQFNVEATMILKCDQGGIYRLTFRPAMGMFDIFKFEIPYILDDTRFAPHGELMDALERQHAARVERLNKLFDPAETTVGVSTMSDYITSTKS